MTAVLYVAFLAFVIAGGALVMRWRRVAWVHVPAFLIGAFTLSLLPATAVLVVNGLVYWFVLATRDASR